LHADTLQQLAKSTGDRLLFRPRLQPFLRVPGAARQLCELHDLFPIRRWDNADDRRRFSHLLIRPKSPSDIVFLQRFHELRDPLIGIFPGLAHPDRYVMLFAKINVLPQHALIR